MTIKKKRIERVRITGKSGEEKRAWDYLIKHDYVTVSSCPRILKGEGMVDLSRFVIVRERSEKRMNQNTAKSTDPIHDSRNCETSEQDRQWCREAAQAKRAEMADLIGQIAVELRTIQEEQNRLIDHCQATGSPIAATRARLVAIQIGCVKERLEQIASKTTGSL